MNHWDTLIDGTSFGLVADYLKSARTGIRYLLHVKDRAMLGEMAARLEQGFQPVRLGGLALAPSLLRSIQEGSVKLSSAAPILNAPRGAIIDPTQVRRSTYSEVIYAPPYYLDHTPGLFEGKVTDQGKGRALPQTQSTSQSRDRDGHGHSH